MLSYEEVEPVFLDLIADYGRPEELSMPTTLAAKNCRFTWPGDETAGG